MRVAAGLADLDAEEPLTADSIVDFGSVSKQFTALAVLQLAENGTLSIDDTVDQYVAGLPGWASEVTLDELIHHLSGIPDYVYLMDDVVETASGMHTGVAGLFVAVQRLG